MSVLLLYISTADTVKIVLLMKGRVCRPKHVEWTCREINITAHCCICWSFHRIFLDIRHSCFLSIYILYLCTVDFVKSMPEIYPSESLNLQAILWATRCLPALFIPSLCLVTFAPWNILYVLKTEARGLSKRQLLSTILLTSHAPRQYINL